MKKILFLCIATALFFPGVASAMERFDIVSTRELSQMLADRAAGKRDFILANTLDEIIFRQSSIPGSINTPWADVKSMESRLGKDKNKLIITY